MAVNPMSPHHATEFRIGAGGFGMRVAVALVLLGALLLWLVIR